MSISENTCYIKPNLCFRDSLCMLACCGQDYYLDFLPSNFPHHLLSSGITLLGARPKTIQAIFMTDLRSIFVGLITLGRMDFFFRDTMAGETLSGLSSTVGCCRLSECGGFRVEAWLEPVRVLSFVMCWVWHFFSEVWSRYSRRSSYRRKRIWQGQEWKKKVCLESGNLCCRKRQWLE